MIHELFLVKTTIHINENQRMERLSSNMAIAIAIVFFRQPKIPVFGEKTDNTGGSAIYVILIDVGITISQFS